MDIDVAVDVAVLDMAMDVDEAVLGVAMAVVGLGMVGVVVGLCIVVVVDVGVGVWGEENGGWRKLNNVAMFKKKRSDFKVQL